MNTVIFILISIFIWIVLRRLSNKIIQMNSVSKFIFILFILFIASEYMYLVKYHEFSFILNCIVPEDVNNGFSRMFSFVFSIFMAFTCLPIKMRTKYKVN